jgi:hypothetical protein
MKEEFLHYIWKYRLYNKPLKTIENEHIKVISPGIHNHNAGPDFSDVRLRIGEALWAGNVEIHVNSSDWYRHGHQHDPAYDNVVLHVVFHHDDTSSDRRIPVLQLKEFFDSSLYVNYQQFINSKRWVPCINQIKEVPAHEISLWLERMLIERLEHKAELIHGFLRLGNNDWAEAFYHTLARSFGFSVNALPFEMMARSLPYRVIARHLDQPMQVEALVFGQAGLLSHDLKDPWPQALFTEYSFLRQKYHLVPIATHLWRFLRLRPVNFPTIRLAQFSALLCAGDGLVARVLESTTTDDLTEYFFGVSASAYWDNHYVFDRLTPGLKKQLGKDAISLLMINAMLPFLFVYGRSIDNDHLCNRALDFFSRLQGEKNAQIRKWKDAGIDVSNAFNTQALIWMKSDYCDKKRCLDCRIGNYLLKPGSGI